MKKILFILILCTSYIATYAQVNVAGYIQTNGTANYPTHIDSMGKAGYRVCYDTTERNSITCLRRKYGMAVYTQSDNSLWILKDSACNNVWEIFAGGGSTDSLNKFKYFVSYLTDTSFTICSKDYSRCDTVAISGSIGIGGTGTVTSISTNNGTGITGGTITSSGTLAIDTAGTISTKANVDYKYDILNALKRAISDTALNSASTTTRGRSQYLIDSFSTAVSGLYLPLTGGTITGNLTVNSFINSLSSISATNVLEGKSDIWHWGDIKVLNKDLSNMEAWVQRKTYYSDGVNLSKIGTASIDTITIAKKADYSSNVASNYTARSFTDKNYVDSSLRHRQKIINDANYTLEDSISIVYFTNLTTTRTLTLPNASLFKGRKVSIVKYSNGIGLDFSGGAVVDVYGSVISSTTRPPQSLTLVSDSTNWVILNNSQDNIWARSGGIIEPNNSGDSLYSILQISVGGFIGGYIEINTGSATAFTVGGQHKFIEFPSASTNTGLILSSVLRGQEYKVRNGKATSITISPSYIDLSGVSQSTISANTAITIVFDGTNYKQF